MTPRRISNSGWHLSTSRLWCFIKALGPPNEPPQTQSRFHRSRAPTSRNPSLRRLHAYPKRILPFWPGDLPSTTISHTKTTRGIAGAHKECDISEGRRGSFTPFPEACAVIKGEYIPCREVGADAPAVQSCSCTPREHL